MAVFSPSAIGTFNPVFNPSDGGSTLTPGEGNSLMSSLAVSKRDKGFIGWLKDLFRQMGASKTNNTYGLTGVRGPNDVVTEGGQLFTSGQQASLLENEGLTPGSPEASEVIDQTANPEFHNAFDNIDFNNPDSMIGAAKDLYSKYPDLAEALLNAGLSEKSNIASYNRSLEASNTTYQRLVEDLRKAGLNPFLAISGMSGSQASSGSTSYGLGSITDLVNTNSTNKKGIATAGIAALALILSALIRVII